MARSTSTNRKVYIPQDMNIQLAASQENPGGRVVNLKQGYVELDDAMAAHPILARLTPVLLDEAERQERLHKAQEERDEAVAAAEAKLGEVRSKVDQERREAVVKASEGYAERRGEALARGHSFNEVHPDLETQRAIALTAPPSSFATSAVAMQPRFLPDSGKPVELPKEDENTKRMREQTEAQTAARQQQATPAGRTAKE